ncbi:hypothetical protein [Kitasatospora sp. NPDC094015]|uniref:hypothetical protein n=1 Tax=Kitasatospora sp. NPDC094015 TaxID=3155205 RepID=UPI00331ABC93
MTNNVKSGEDFRALLRGLMERFEDLGAEAPQIDDVLLRWAAALPDLPDQGSEPGWSGLADQLLSAVDAPSVGLAEPAALRDEPSVASPAELRALLLALAADFARNRAWTEDRLARGLWAGDGGGWASGSMARFMESWDAWLGARLGKPPRFPGTPPIEPVTWASVAWQLGAARVYE